MKPTLCLLAELYPSVAERVEKVFEVVYRKNPGNPKAGSNESELVELMAKANPEVAVIEAQPFTARVLEASARLGLIASVRTTPSNIDLAAAGARKISITNAPGRNAVAVAEFTIAFLLSCARMIPQSHHALKRGDYLLPEGVKPNNNPNDVIWTNASLSKRPYTDFRGKELRGSALGLYGFGQIGRMVADLAKAFGMRILVCDPYVDAAAIASSGGEKVDFTTLLAESDFLTLHAKVTNETRGAFNIEAFRAMKESAYLVNTARGALIRQEDLFAALSGGLIAGAALDVFESEPLCLGDRLLSLDNLIHTPHIGGATADVVRHQSELVERNLFAWLEGKTLPDLWPVKH